MTTLFAAFAVIISGILIYESIPTKIAFVNFQDAQMAEIDRANQNSFIELHQTKVKESDFSEIVNYPVIYLFHISALSQAQKSNLSKAMENGAKVHAFSSTSKENDFSNITGDDLKFIKAAYQNGGEYNMGQFLNYSRKIFDQASFFTEDIGEPKSYPKDVFYRIGTQKFHETPAEYWSYYKKEGLFNPSGKTIAIINSSVGVQSQFRSYQDSIITNLESKGHNVACIAGYRKRFQNLKAINPDMVIYFPHGRINMMGGDEAVNWLKEKNILLLTPQVVHSTYQEWLDDQQGMSGGLMGQNIVVPEIDGAIHPFAVAAKYINEKGYHTFKAIPGRIPRFCETVHRWLTLKEKPNANKKLCIYYYKGAGKNALVAGGLEVGQSLFSLLNRLKKEGYHTGDLPEDYATFMEKIQRQGPVLGDYATGSFEKFLTQGNPDLISTSTYESWVKSELDPKAFADVVKQYGPAPGKYLSTKVNDTSYLAIPRVEFGHITLLPVLPAAMENNEFKLVHGVKKAPPHAYLASYLWSRMAFQADVIAHFGAHGSVEFTPWKQVLLSLQDWPDALTAPVPHLYVYSIDNIGEAMMAKRRTYATMLSHLTPSYSEADLYGDFKELSKFLHDYKSLTDGPLRTTLKEKIIRVCDSLHIQKDLGIHDTTLAELSIETADDLHVYVHHLEREKITIGRHTLGVSYADKEQSETVRMMSVDPIASSLKQLSKIRGALNKTYLISHHHNQGHSHTHSHAPNKSHPKNRPHNHSHSEKHEEQDYPALAAALVQKIQSSSEDPLNFMAPQDKKELNRLEEAYGDQKEKAPISPYYGGHYAKKKQGKTKNIHGHHQAGSPHKKTTSTAKKEALVYDPKTHKMVPKSSLREKAFGAKDAKNLALHFAATRKTAAGINWLKNDKEFKEISSLLDHKNLHQFKMAAKMDASLSEKAELASNKKYMELVSFLQDSAQLAPLLSFLEQDATKKRISSYQAVLDSMTLDKVMSKEVKNDFFSVFEKPKKGGVYRPVNKQIQPLTQLQSNVGYVMENKAVILESKRQDQDLKIIQAALVSNKTQQLINKSMEVISSSLRKITQQEKQLLGCLKQLQEAITSVRTYQNQLMVAPQMELEAFINGMNGGFIAPSSGGDPISNPLAVPTGKNLYSINAEVTPTKEAFETGAKMAKQILQKHLDKHGEYPKKIAYSLWSGEFIRNQGLNIGQIFYMLGVEPVRNQRGRVHDVQLIPMSELKRPRIDVVVQTSGQFRDLAASRISLINKAVQLASNAEEESSYANYVKEGTLAAEASMKQKGIAPINAKKHATVRVFGGVNGNYGTGIMELVEQGDKWEKEEEIADQYLKNMGAMYADGSWSSYEPGMFETMLENTDVVVHPRSSNVTGPISLDHVYEFMGGITASIRVTTGKDPDGYFNDYRNKFDPNVQSLKEAIWTETRTNLFNPKFIKAQLQEGETAAEGFAENFRDTYGWNVMKPDAIDQEIWEGYYDIYVQDKLNLGTVDFFKNTNPYALQEMTAVMLETVRKGYWKPSQEVIKETAKLHAELIKTHEAGCSGFVCDNFKLKKMIENNLSGELKASYQEALSKVREGETEGGKPENSSESEEIVLKKEEITLKKMKELLKENKSAFITLIVAMLIFVGATSVGIYQRRNQDE